MERRMKYLDLCKAFVVLAILELLSGRVVKCAVKEAFRRDPGHPQWHHSAFQDISDLRSEVHDILHSSTAEVPFRVPLEINIVLVGFNGDGGFRYTLDARKLEEFMKRSFPSHHPACLETALPLDIEHDLHYNVIPVGQPELIALEQAVRNAMVHAGSARQHDYGKEVPLLEVEATTIEPIFQRLYTYLFGVEEDSSAAEINGPVPNAIFILNFDKVRMDPGNKEIDYDSLMSARIEGLTTEEMKQQEGNYIYRYRYNGGGASQMWLSSGRYAVIDLSAGPCTYGKIEAEEGSVSYRTVPRLFNILFPRGQDPISASSTHEIVTGQLSALIYTTIEHVIAPDVRFETVDLATRILIPVIVLQNHNHYNLFEGGHNYSINMPAIETEVKKMLHTGQEVVLVGGAHSLHRHEKLSIAVSKALRGHSVHETKSDGRFHVRTKMYLDGSILKDEMERSADVLAAGLLEVADPELSSKFFLRQRWMADVTDSEDSVIKSRPNWLAYREKFARSKKEKMTRKRQQGELYRTYGTRVIPVFVLSLAGMDQELLMEGETQVWTSNDAVIVLQHENNEFPLSYVSETKRRYAAPMLSQRHIIAGLASAVGGLTAPYEKASHIHQRPVLNWLWATGCHPFGPFSNVSKISQMLRDTALRNTIYARVDATLHKIRDTTKLVQSFANEHLKTPIGEPVKGQRKKTKVELWLDKFYTKKTNLPEPFPHELVERLESYLSNLEEELVGLSSLLYDHRLEDAHRNSSEILQNALYTEEYAHRVLLSERDKMRCCSVKYEVPVQSSQAFIYGGILISGFIVYFVVIFFSSPER
uniref:DUF7906 domain-containing protein n=1 Tax=Juniperus convallium var. microsperma TaxID=2773310 RepID=A0A3S6N0I2_9CONI|nr:hypothetical protein [Juniperus microsperma]